MKFQNKIYQICANEEFLFIETRNFDKQIFLSVYVFHQKSYLIVEKNLTLPAYATLKAAGESSVCYFVEFFQEDLPEVAYYHQFSENGELLKTEKNCTDLLFSAISPAQLYVQNTDYWQEINQYLISLGEKKIESDCWYAEKNQTIFLVFVCENQTLFLCLEKDKITTLGIFAAENFSKNILFLCPAHLLLLNQTANELIITDDKGYKKGLF